MSYWGEGGGHRRLPCQQLFFRFMQNLTVVTNRNSSVYRRKEYLFAVLHFLSGTKDCTFAYLY